MILTSVNTHNRDLPLLNLKIVLFVSSIPTYKKTNLIIHGQQILQTKIL